MTRTTASRQALAAACALANCNVSARRGLATTGGLEGRGLVDAPRSRRAAAPPAAAAHVPNGPPLPLLR